MRRELPRANVSPVRRWLGRAASLLRGGGGDGPVDRRDPLGGAGERLAAAYLRRQGYRVIGSNLRVPMGEADLLAVAPDGETVVLVEVKSRRVGTGEPGAERSPGEFVAPPPEASITAHKRAKLAEILHHLARANGWMRRPLRIDAVAIEWPAGRGGGEPVVRHHAGAVSTAAGGRSR